MTCSCRIPVFLGERVEEVHRRFPGPGETHTRRLGVRIPIDVRRHGRDKQRLRKLLVIPKFRELRHQHVGDQHLQPFEPLALRVEAVHRGVVRFR